MYALRPFHLGRPRRVPAFVRAVIQSKWTMADAHGSGNGKRKLGQKTSLGSVRELQVREGGVWMRWNGEEGGGG